MSPAARRWIFRCAALAWCAFIFYLSSQSEPPVPGFFDFIPFDRIPGGDKIGHFMLYAVLGWLSAGALTHEKSPSLQRRALLFAALWGALYGASDEFHQRFVPGRTVDILDWTADVLGAAAAAAAYVKVKKRKEINAEPAEYI